MKPEEAIEMLRGMQNKKVDYAELVCAPAFASGYTYVYPEPEDYAIEEAIKAIEEVQQYREIGTVEEIRKIIKQGIDNCYMAHKYEQPGYEEGMCAGLRTMNGDGEPAYKCQLCRLYYLSDSERSDNHDGE